MKFARLVHMPEIGAEQIVLYDTFEEAERGDKQPGSKGRGTYGPIYEVTKIYDPIGLVPVPQIKWGMRQV